MKNSIKNILVLISLFTIISLNLISQNREAIQATFILNGNNININSNLEAFKINKFTLGWHWGDQYKISKALSMNQKDIPSGENFDSINTGTNLFIRSEKIINNKKYYFSSHAGYDDSPVFTKSLKYDPTLFIDLNNVYKLNKRVGDPSNPVFGFLNKKGRVLTDPTFINYSRLIIDSAALKNQVILSDPWPSSLLYYVAEGKQGVVDSIQRDFSGRSFYISINLRRFLNSNATDNTPVLKIKVPYITWRDSSYNKYDTTKVKVVDFIVGTDTTYKDSITNINTTVLYQRVRMFRYAEFDKVPSTTNNDTTILANNYGTIWNLMPFGPGSNKPSEIIITRKMLPLNNGDITISGYLNFAGRIQVGQNIVGNHPLKSLPNYNRELDVIDSLKIEVTYLDTMQIAIDWVKFETPNTRNLLHGKYEEELKASIQGDLDFFTQSQYSSNNVKPKRWVVHIEGSPINWEGERYFRKVVGDVTTGAVGPSLCSHWDEFLGNTDKWIETSAINSLIAAPYIAKNKDKETTTTYNGKTVTNTNLWKTFGLGQGYLERYFNDPLRSLNRFNSGYETFLRSDYDSVKTIRELSLYEYTTNPKYVANHGGNMSFQTYYEWGLYTNYINPYTSGYVFSDKPWFGQTFVQEFFHPTNVYENNTRDSSIHILEGLRRTHTGEEINLLMWNMLIMGAKGIIYDGGFDYASDVNLRGGQTKIVPNESFLIDSSRFNTSINNLFNMDNYTFLNSPYSTGDFIDDRYDHIPIKSRMYINSKPEMLDTIAKYYGQLDSNGIPLKERIYIGKRSIRNKMYQTHNWIRANETELMNLKLMAWYGKGFKIWEKNHSSVDTNFFSKFVLKDFIGTRKIYVVDSINGNRLNKSNNTYIDSGNTYADFVDVTLLKNNTKSIDSVFYIGVQNRRTDPTIYFTENANDKHFIFLSSSEFEDLCKNGGKNPMRPNGATYPDTTWQKYWWNRLGAREITIPFDYVSSNTNNYNLLKIEELQGEYKDSNGVISDNNLPFHLQAKYNQKIDTVMGQDGKLVLKLLPGQGKLLKVSILKPDMSINGRLDHSNQSKLVAYPVLDSTGNETNKIQYHVVYFREDSSLIGKPNRVYYRKSLQMAKNDASENIIWQNEILISNNIKALDNIDNYGNFSNVNKGCDYPAVVVRRDGNLLKAYITYTCGTNVTANESAVVLTVLNTTDTISQTIVFNKVMASFTGVNRKWYGTPTINASANHNYIAWADSTIGIVAGAILPNSLNFIDKVTIPNTVFGGILYFSSSNHPSLNTYSRISAGEDNCALVWQHSPNTNNYYKDILYTRLKVENNSLKTYSSTTSSGLIKENNIFRINTDVNTLNSNQFPVVFRELDSLDYVLPNNKVKDVIAWQNTYANYQRSNINGRALSSRDSSTDSSLHILGWMPVALQDNYRYSFLPDLAQQSGLIIGGEMKYPYGKYLMNFVRGNSSGYQTYNFPTTGSWVSDVNINNNSFKILNQISNKTKQPHLAKYKEPNLLSNIWRNRRVYEEYSSNNYNVIPNIVSNGRFFYKNNVTEELEAESFVGFYKGNKKYQINLPIVNNQLISLQLPFTPIIDLSNFITYNFDNSQDTIFSDWFDVNNVAELSFKCYGFNDTIMVAKIQKQSDNSFVNLNLPNITSDTTGKLGEYTLINGGLDSYRLCFIRLDTNYQYTESLILEGLPIADTVSLKTGNNSSNIVDLSGQFTYSKNKNEFELFISPNPVNDIVYITPINSDLKNKNHIKIEIIDILGNIINITNTNIGETISIETKDLPQGVYFVKCSEIIEDWILPTILKTSKFIINR